MVLLQQLNSLRLRRDEGAEKCRCEEQQLTLATGALQTVMKIVSSLEAPPPEKVSGSNQVKAAYEAATSTLSSVPKAACDTEALILSIKNIPAKPDVRLGADGPIEKIKTDQILPILNRFQTRCGPLVNVSQTFADVLV